MKITDYGNGFIRTYDDFLDPTDASNIHNYLLNLRYSFGETDESGTPPTGLITNLETNSPVYQTLYSAISNIKELNDCTCDRAYVNLFAPKEDTYFHHDFTDYTVLYYPNFDWNINDGGETKFYFTKNIFEGIIQTNSEDMPIMISIAPIPNRLLIFNGDVLHSATSFKNKHRFSIAFKFLRNNNEQ